MFSRSLLLAGCVAVASAGLCPAANQFVQHNLVSDLQGYADKQDTNLVNPWGICESSGSPFWISDNGTGLSTLYDSSGNSIPLVVTIPAPANATPPGNPSGCLFNGTTGFPVGGNPALFIFASEQGVIAAWNSGTTAQIAVDNSASGAVYKGLAMATRAAGPTLYAANFNAGTVDIWDANWNWVSIPGAFTDPAIPSGFAPFNIYNFNGRLLVTYAKQDDEKHDDVAGPGNGYLDVYGVDGELLYHLISGGALNSPWGIALAPTYFGDFSGLILVGNFGDGKINAYNPLSGQWMGNLQDAYGDDIEIPGLWGIQVGNGGKGGDPGALYFTAGIPGPDTVESHGLFGVIQPDAVIASVAQAATQMPQISSGAMAAVKGFDLAATARSAGTADMVDGRLATSLDGVSVAVDGRPAYLTAISPSEIDFIVPPDTDMGNVPVVVYNNELASASVWAWMQPFAPGFNTNAGTSYVMATHADGSPVGATTLVPGKSTPAQSNETIDVWGTGFGPTNPPMDGRVIYAPVPAETWPTVSIAGLPATVTWAGLTAAGTYDIRVTLPSVPSTGTATRDVPVVATINGQYSTQSGLLLTVIPAQ